MAKIAKKKQRGENEKSDESKKISTINDSEWCQRYLYQTKRKINMMIYI